MPMVQKRFYFVKAVIIAVALSHHTYGFLVPRGKVTSRYGTLSQRPLLSSQTSLTRYEMAERAAHSMSDVKSEITVKIEEIRREARMSTRNLLPFLKELRPTRCKTDAILESFRASHLLDFWEIFITVVMAWCLLPITNFVSFNIFQRGEDGGLFGRTGQSMIKTISNYFKIDAFVYLADALAIIADGLGFNILKKINFALIVSKVGRTLWAMSILKAIKGYFLKATFRGKTEADQKLISLINRITNILLYFVTVAILVEILSVDIGIAISSLLSLGGLGTVILSLAAKRIAEQLLSGIGLKVSNRFAVGDEIELGDGTGGVVHRISMSHMEIRQSDENIISIPNSQVFHQRVMNLSKIQRNQVKQKLWFRYDDIDKMPLVTEEIRSEIKASCPKLIEKGRPFRVHWRDMEKDHLEVVVDCRFNIPQCGNAKWDNRQQVLEAISRAVKRCGMEFARPNYFVESDRTSSENFVPEKDD